MIMCFEDRSSLCVQRHCNWSIESVHHGFINLCFSYQKATLTTLAISKPVQSPVSVPVKYLWLRPQTGSLIQGPEKLIVHVTGDAGLLFQESPLHHYMASAQRQMGSMIKGRLTQHPDLCTLQVCRCLALTSHLLSLCSPSCTSLDLRFTPIFI